MFSIFRGSSAQTTTVSVRGEASDRGSRPLAAREARSFIQSIRRRGWPTLRYLWQTEPHTFAFSVAANAILSFFPAVLLMLTFAKYGLHSQTMYSVIMELVRDGLPSNQEFVIRNLNAMVEARRGDLQVFALLMLYISCTGIFLPLEVALHKVWRCRGDRSYIGNQFIALLLALGCGALALGSVALTAGNRYLLETYMGGRSILALSLGWLIMKFFAFMASIGVFFLIYWLLPNGKVPWRRVLPAAIAMGVLWEAAKHMYVFLLPWLDFRDIYGPFYISVTLIFWGYVSGLLLLGGAFLVADSGPVTPSFAHGAALREDAEPAD